MVVRRRGGVADAGERTHRVSWKPIELWGRGGLVVRPLASHLDESDSIPVGVAVRRVFSGISRFSHPNILALLHTLLASPTSSLKTSMLWNTEISPHSHSATGLRVEAGTFPLSGLGIKFPGGGGGGEWGEANGKEKSTGWCEGEQSGSTAFAAVLTWETSRLPVEAHAHKLSLAPPLHVFNSLQPSASRGCFLPGKVGPGVYSSRESRFDSTNTAENGSKVGILDRDSTHKDYATETSCAKCAPKHWLTDSELTNCVLLEVRRDQSRRRNRRAGEGDGISPTKPANQRASSGTIPTCESPGVARPGTEPASPRWEASSLTSQPPRPRRGSKF
ncbi:hypothetical protein PR048_016744 [Dryococelus australis]|uniref:Uncharacterized protein n=1 Tax=Dryococelus australis TaxID=614101 RepID=A0ABQ9H7J9_9NEOP|nr:hypothetical protein PR048_016744 [Dryococelus australis]